MPSNPLNRLTKKQRAWTKFILRSILITVSTNARLAQQRKEQSRVAFLEDVVRGNGLHHPKCPQTKQSARASLGLGIDCTCWTQKQK